MLEFLDTTDETVEENKRIVQAENSHISSRKRRILEAKLNREKKSPQKLYSRRLMKIIKMMEE